MGQRSHRVVSSVAGTRQVRESDGLRSGLMGVKRRNRLLHGRPHPPRPPPTTSSGPAVPESCFPPSPFPPMSPFRGPRPVRETAGGQSALTSGPAPAHRRPTRQRPGRCPSTETSADSTGPAARRSAPTRLELPLLRGQPGTTRRVLPLLATRWSHDRGKTRLKPFHERGKRQCAAAHAKPSTVPQSRADGGNTNRASANAKAAPVTTHPCRAPCFADRPPQNRNPCPRARRWQPGPGRLPRPAAPRSR